MHFNGIDSLLFDQRGREIGRGVAHAVLSTLIRDAWGSF